MEALKPGERKTLPFIEWLATGQEKGRYFAEIKVLEGDEVLAESDFHFHIGYEVEKNNLINISEEGGIFKFWKFIGLGLIVLGGVLMIIYKKKIARSKKKRRKRKRV